MKQAQGRKKGTRRGEGRRPWQLSPAQNRRAPGADPPPERAERSPKDLGARGASFRGIRGASLHRSRCPPKGPGPGLWRDPRSQQISVSSDFENRPLEPVELLDGGAGWSPGGHQGAALLARAEAGAVTHERECRPVPPETQAPRPPHGPPPPPRGPAAATLPLLPTRAPTEVRPPVLLGPPCRAQRSTSETKIRFTSRFSFPIFNSFFIIF